MPVASQSMAAESRDTAPKARNSAEEHSTRDHGRDDDHATAEYEHAKWKWPRARSSFKVAIK
jgi:hypothetical protein